jgi:TonB-dependent starch-binding outer membrane protein SusC
MRKDYLKKYVLLCAFLTMSVWAFAQSGGIKGKVVDENNQPLPGAAVTIDGTTIGATSDLNGNYAITGLNAKNYTVTAKFLGYIALKKAATVSNDVVTVNFGLEPENNNLNEVVVIGYGTEKKKDLTGSIATVTAKDFNTGSITTPEELIQGKVAGVSIITNSGAPGAGSQILIRGGASVNGSSEPLIVIDGVPLTNESTGGVGKVNSIAGAANPLDLINPNDIASFSILKDASAAAIYGNRASNGVIIITTKKGQSGKPRIDFSAQLSVGQLTKEAPVLSADQFRTFINQIATAPGDTSFTNQLHSANTDWQKQIYQTAVSNADNLSVSGTVGKSLPYRISVGYDDENGIMKTSSLERYSTAINLNPSLFTDHLKINFNFLGTELKQRFANQSAVGDAASFNPTDPVYSGNSNYGGFYEILAPSSGNPENLNTQAPRNPLGLLEEEQNNSNVYRAITSLALDYKFHFFPDLHANVNVAYDGSKGEGTDVIPGTAASQYPGTADANGVIQTGNNSQYKNIIGNSTFDGYFSYSHDFKSIKSHIDAVAGYSEQTNLNTTYNYLSYFANGEVKPLSAFNYPTDVQKNELTSLYGRLNYAYDDKYLLTGTVRQDVSTKFAPGIRTGYFPSVAGAWVISNEDFLKGNPTLSNLKLRLEYGVTGNEDGIGNYDYLSPYSLGNKSAEYAFGIVNGEQQFYQIYRPGAFYPGRTWESTATTNAAVDFGFLHNMITGSFDVYYRKTKNLLATINEPGLTNFSNTIVANVGDMEDRGAELSVNVKIINSNDISWNAGLNATLNRNKVTNLSQEPNPNYPGLPVGGISGGIGTDIQLDQIGYAKNSFFTYQQVYGANGKPLDGVFVDKNGDGIINSSDLSVNHSPDPQEYFGINSDLRVKKWNVGFSARAELGNYAYNNVASSTGFKNSFLNSISLDNGSSSVLASGFTNAEYLSDYYIENASFFRMDNVHLGYNFGKVFKNTGDLRISGNVQNVFVITKYTGVDPEITNGIDNNLYPRPRTYVLGLNLSL